MAVTVSESIGAWLALSVGLLWFVFLQTWFASQRTMSAQRPVKGERALKYCCATRIASLLALPVLLMLSSCAMPLVGASAPAPEPTSTLAPTLPPLPTSTATPTLPSAYAPAGWSVYWGDHFTIAYPPGWYEMSPAAPPETGVTQTIIELTGPQPRDQITVVESTFPQDQLTDFCATTGQTATLLAGLPMTYQVVEGVHRQWTFVTDKQISYQLSTFDGDSSATMQAQSDAILATFRPDDTAPGCP